jgi:hypothetical protein
MLNFPLWIIEDLTAFPKQFARHCAIHTKPAFAMMHASRQMNKTSLTRTTYLHFLFTMDFYIKTHQFFI